MIVRSSRPKWRVHMCSLVAQVPVSRAIAIQSKRGFRAGSIVFPVEMRKVPVHVCLGGSASISSAMSRMTTTDIIGGSGVVLLLN